MTKGNGLLVISITLCLLWAVLLILMYAIQWEIMEQSTLQNTKVF
ncbi:hypothetical protein Cal7507_0577 [Calothrix sp. PCC 7507]|nr:hypothetical protein Cal7507_0577 [Calothrix sp. PCC 7507]